MLEIDEWLHISGHRYDWIVKTAILYPLPSTLYYAIMLLCYAMIQLELLSNQTPEDFRVVRMINYKGMVVSVFEN